MKNTKFPEIVKQMKLHKQNLKDMVELLELKQLSQVSRRLSGEVEWTFGDVETLCKYYNMDFWELFKKEE